MKARDWCKALAVLAASLVVAGCGMVSKQKYEEADARALKATASLNETTAALEKAKAEKTVRDQVGAIAKELDQARAKVKDAEQLSATIQKLTQDNKQLQAALDRLKSMAAPRTEPNVPAAGAATR
jgi:predicted RNase H-like nuclease (RuvC/YqgF family)